MADVLSYTFSLVDQVSATAKNMASAMSATAKQMSATAAQAKKAFADIEKGAKSSTPGIVRLMDSFKSPYAKAALVGTYNWIGKTFGPKVAGWVAQSATKLYMYNDILKDFGTNIGDVAKGTASFLGKVGGGALLGVAGLTAAGGALALGASFFAGKMVYSGMKLITSAAMFKESTITALTLVTKSSAIAGRLFNKAVDFAERTPFSAEQVAGAYQKLATAGFKELQIPIVLKAVGDMASVKGFSTEVQDRIILALSQIKSKGKLQGQEMLQLTEVGVNAGDVYERLAKRLHKTKDEVIKLQSAGKISANMGITAVVESIKEGISGGKLGNAMTKFSQTMAGRLERLKSAPMNLALRMDAGPLAGVGKIVGSLADSLSSKGKLGSAIISTGNALAKAFEIKDPKATFAKIEGAMLGIVRLVKSAIPGVKAFIGGFASGIEPALKMMGGFKKGDGAGQGFAATMKVVGLAIGNVISATVGFVRGIIMAGNAVSMTMSMIWGVAAQVVSYFQSMYYAGVEMVQGLIDGISSGTGAVIGAATAMANSAVQAARNTLGSHSPSTVFKEVGGTVDEGMAEGIGAGRSQSAANDMVSTASYAASRGRSGGRNAPINITINVSAGEGAKDIAAAVRTELLLALEGMAEQVAA